MGAIYDPFLNSKNKQRYALITKKVHTFYKNRGKISSMHFSTLNNNKFNKITILSGI